MHAKTYSEVTSSAPSSPDHNRRAAYFVQSPSHDGEKATPSFHSTPMGGSPTGSPPHFVGRHSRESSAASRFSGSLKPAQSKVRKNRKGCDAVKEEGLLEDAESGRGFPRRCYFAAFVGGFFAVFALFALILWGASRPQKPEITMLSMKFERFAVQAGSDDSGVSTDMITVNSTLKFKYQNRGTFFGVAVSSTPVDLSYSQLKIASGNIKEFYKKRKDGENVSVIVAGDKSPMYGSGASLSTPTGMTTLPVQLDLEFTVRSRGYVLGKLVKPRFYNKVECTIVLDMKKLSVPISLKNSCTYDRR